MHTIGDRRVIAEGGTDHLAELLRALGAAGIEGEVVAPPRGQCGS
jgi:hypothetical protein